MEFDIYFPLIEEILHGELHPERPVNADGHHYTIRLQEQHVAQTGQVGNYQLRYLKPITPKCTWYLQLLKSETNGYCLDAREYLSTEENEFVRNYLRKQILDDHLTTSLMRVGEVIRSKNYRLEELENPVSDADRERLSNIYIWHLLKVCLVKAYLEVQELLDDVIAWKHTEESLYQGPLKELPPLRHFLPRSTPHGTPPVQKSTPPTPNIEYSTANVPEKEPDTAMDNRQFYDTKKMCELYNCSESTLKRRVKEGIIPKPIESFGKKNLYCKNEVDLHLASMKKKQDGNNVS